MENLSVMIILVGMFIFTSVGANTVQLITPCDGDKDCEHLGEGSSCVQKICMCNGTRFCSERVLIKVTKIGLDCRVDAECQIDHSECAEDRRCKCSEGYVAASNGKACLPVSTGIGEACNESVQCYTRTAHTGCQNNKCVCPQHMHEHNGSCYKSVVLRGRCSDDAECSQVLFTECRNSLCSCKEHHVSNSKGSICLPAAEGEHSPCFDDNQCVVTLGMASHCDDGFCRCKELHQLKNSTNQCVRDLLLGETCRTHSDCRDFSWHSRTECVLGVCKCKSFYEEIDGFCLSSSRRLLASIGLLIFIPYMLLIF